MRRTMFATVLALALGLAPATSAAPFPDLISLPDGFQPEGIAVGNGTTFYAGSIPTGAVVRGDLRTGEIETLVGPGDRAAIGMAIDAKHRLWVAGGPTGDAYVYDARTGATLATYDLTGGDTFINDVVVTGDAAWFTDSFNPTLYRVPLGPGHALGAAAEAVPLGGDYAHDPGNFNLNGIDATPSGGALLVVQSSTGRLYAIDPATGDARLVDLGADDVASGDGILLDGTTLYVVQNFLNRIAVVELAPDLTSGAVTGTIADPAFDIPTTIAEHGNALYAVNARFTTPPDPDTEYHVVRVAKA